MTGFALVDANNFYVSCERVFNPKLEGRPVVVNGIAIQVLAERDVNRCGGTGNNEGKDLKPVPQIPIASHEKSIAHIVAGTPPVLVKIVLVHGEAGIAGRVAIGEAP